ncbi:MAG: hypothetical protein SP1CHLAM54_11560 [Chlamydiia bacterium]|nr:hypothetical protein [Chlamydiia bacterium]MCH9616059.1 hypothetical protein [Chlamydiia bacterium]MCH9629082.1 hypothetical protein [Chlamydiia bacterium]
MGRRNDHSKTELKKMMVKAGKEILKTEGIKGLTARGLAKHIGYSAGTIYNVFDNFYDLMFIINSETAERLVKKINKSITNTPDPKRLGRELGKAYLDFAKKNNAFWNLLFTHPIPHSQAPEWYREKVEVLFAMLDGPINDLILKNNDQAKLATRVLWSGLHGITTLFLSEKYDFITGADPEILFEALFANYLKGALLADREDIVDLEKVVV